jgi:predicted Zn-dependent protease
MTTADALIEFLEHARASDGSAVVGWRFELADSEAVRLGIRKSQSGGPYEGPGVALRLAASLEVHWSDGLMTRTILDRRALTVPFEYLAEWRETAVAPRGERLPPLAESVALPHVDVYDRRLADAVSADPSPLLRLVDCLHDGVSAAGALRTDAFVRATLSRRTVATSRGFRADWHDTQLGMNVWADELGGASYDRRRLPSLEQASRLAREAAGLAASLRQPALLPAGARGVLFVPPVVEQVLGRFLLPNLAGRAIRDGRSYFSRADLDARRPIAQPGMSLLVDTTLPYEPASAPCSPEGVPAGRVTLIDGVRLVTPIVEMESAAELGYPPTPRPRGRPHVVLTTLDSPLDWDAALDALGNGVVVHALPGLHTQAVRRGAYALVTPDAQQVVNGRVGGRCAVRLAGSVIDHVSQASSRLVRVPGGTGVGLLVVDGVTLLPA